MGIFFYTSKGLLFAHFYPPVFNFCPEAYNMDEKTPQTRKKTIAGKIFRVIYKTILIIILLFATIALLLLTPPVQNFARKKATEWLSKKLNTKVDIGRIYIGFPKTVILEKIYVEDQQKDTLLSGGKLKVDISMLKLLKNKVEVNNISLSEITAKVKRILPDTIYNFQFIIDAFASADTVKTKTKDSSTLNISVKDVVLDKIRLVYNDTVSGNDMTLWLEHFDTNIDVFDLNKKRFNVPVTNINGIRADIYQHKPLVKTVDVVADTAKVAEHPTIDFNFDEFNLSDIYIDYGNDVSAFYSRLNLRRLTVNADNVDLKNQSIVLNKIELDSTTASIRLGKKESAKIITKQVKQEARQQANLGWAVLVKNIELNNNNFAYANDNYPHLKRGMDYAHLDAKSVTLHVKNFVFAPDSIGGNITKGQLAEQCGFQLNTFQTEFLYSGHQAYLHNLLLETPGTTLRRTLEIRYDSLEALKKNIGKMQLNADINNSHVLVKDILTFAPFLASQPAFSGSSATWMLNGRVTGSVANMNIQFLQLKALNNTNLDVKGTIAGLPHANKLRGNLVIKKLQTSRKDIEAVVPKGTLPTNITLPEMLNLNGTVAGSLQNAHANLNLATSLGDASVNGTIKNATDKIRASYNADITARQLNLGVILQNDSMFGPLTATIAASGTGFDLKTASANVNATINSVVLKSYNYKDIKLHADIAAQKGNFSLNIKDPNISIDMNGRGDISGKYPAVAFNAVIDTIRTNLLHFTKDTLEYRGNISADFANTDPANLEGELLVTKSVLTANEQHYPFDTIALNSGITDTGKFLRLRSDAIALTLTGNYNLAQMGSVFMHSIQPYYLIGSAAAINDTIQDYDFRFNADIVNGPLLKIFIPTLNRLEPVKIQGHFSSDNGWQTSVDAPLIIMGTTSIRKLKFNAGTSGNTIRASTTLEEFSNGTSMNIYATAFNAEIAENNIKYALNIKDVNNKNKYRISGRITHPEEGIYALSLSLDSLLLNYDKWNISDSNIIDLNKGDIHVSNFILSKRDQQLSINSTAPYPNAPVEMKMTNFRIATITAFAKQDSAVVDGVINGQLIIKDIPTQPTFTSDLTVTDLMFRSDTVGNLQMKVSNTREKLFNADITLTGKGNDIEIVGDYQVKPANQGVVDLKMQIRQLQVSSIQAFSMGAISYGKGYINGNIDIKGTFDKPDVNGQLNFHEARFSPSILGSYFLIDKQSITINNQGVVFNSFTILDSSKNELVLDGNAYTTNFINYKLDLDLSANNFQALNSTKQNNKLFYGQFYFDTDLHISGTEARPAVNGSLIVNDKTKLTVVLPQSQPEVEAREGIVRFITVDSARVDTTVLIPQADSLNKSSLRGMDISVNIEVVKEAELTLILDEGNGDFLRMKGSAQLTGGIDPSGKTTLTGSYEIEDGAYQLSLNLLQRQFKIQKGSKIIWLGEPTHANVDVTAIYVANTAPITLVENQIDVANLNMYKQKLPFNVQLILTGELLKPDINFDISLPAEKSFNVDASVIENINTRLIQLKSEPSELNKQVFALLLLGRFVSENPFATSSGGGGGFNAGTMARQSVSKLLTEQLNSLAANLISGVDVNFDVASIEDYTTGQMKNRTDLNVSLSKQLLNDRLRVSVGSNFELEGPQQSNQRSNNLAGNIALDYVLSRDGRYMIRAYRKNEYAGELDGYIIETGVNFILSFNYDHISELFKAPKERRAKRIKRRNKAPIENVSGEVSPAKTTETNSK